MNASTPVILISGWAQTEQALAPLQQALSPSSGFVVTRICCASFLSASATNADPPANRAPSDYAVALASRLNRPHSSAALVGWSMGGMPSRAGPPDSISASGT